MRKKGSVRFLTRYFSETLFHEAYNEVEQIREGLYVPTIGYTNNDGLPCRTVGFSENRYMRRNDFHVLSGEKVELVGKRFGPKLKDCTHSRLAENAMRRRGEPDAFPYRNLTIPQRDIYDFKITPMFIRFDDEETLFQILESLDGPDPMLDDLIRDDFLRRYTKEKNIDYEIEHIDPVELAELRERIKKG